MTTRLRHYTGSSGMAPAAVRPVRLRRHHSVRTVPRVAREYYREVSAWERCHGVARSRPGDIPRACGLRVCVSWRQAAEGHAGDLFRPSAWLPASGLPRRPSIISRRAFRSMVRRWPASLCRRRIAAKRDMHNLKTPATSTSRRRAIDPEDRFFPLET